MVVRDFCGGWIRKEEETELRNHLEWARVLVKGGESRIPKEVKIECEGVGYVIQIWDETLTRFHAREDKVEVSTGECQKTSTQTFIWCPLHLSVQWGTWAAQSFMKSLY